MAQLDDKDIILLSAPDDPKPPWPVWPGYTPPFDLHALGARALYLAAPAGRFMEFGQVLEIVAVYDQRLSAVERELWAANGMLKRDET